MTDIAANEASLARLTELGMSDTLATLVYEYTLAYRSFIRATPEALAMFSPEQVNAFTTDPLQLIDLWQETGVWRIGAEEVSFIGLVDDRPVPSSYTLDSHILLSPSREQIPSAQWSEEFVSAHFNAWMTQMYERFGIATEECSVPLTMTAFIIVMLALRYDSVHKYLHPETGAMILHFSDTGSSDRPQISMEFYPDFWQYLARQQA